MSDTIITLNHKSSPMNIKYKKNCYGFSDNNNNNTKYLFELVINGDMIGDKYFRAVEDNKYAHLIKLSHEIKMSDIKIYKASLRIIPSEELINFELEGNINTNESSSTQRSENMYIEFTQNDIGNTMCCCFYTGADQNKIFASPPN